MVRNATALFLMVELFYSAIEVLCDFIEIRENPKIKLTKEIPVSTVGIGVLLLATIMTVEFIRLGRLFTDA